MRLAVIDPPSISTPTLPVELTFKTCVGISGTAFQSIPLSPQDPSPRKTLLCCFYSLYHPYCSMPAMECSPCTLSRLAVSSLIPVPHTAHSPQLGNAHPTLLHLHSHTHMFIFGSCLSHFSLCRMFFHFQIENISASFLLSFAAASLIPALRPTYPCSALTMFYFRCSFILNFSMRFVAIFCGVKYLLPYSVPATLKRALAHGLTQIILSQSLP